MREIIFIFSFLFFCQTNAQKKYFKDYFENGKLKSEGWINQNQKVDYWFYYFENGIKKEEGHYIDNQKSNWWIYYNPNQEINRKSEYKRGKMNGLSILYKQNKIVKAEKYTMGKKIKEWNTINEFMKDN